MIVVAIGASAGGLLPLQELFDALPSDTQMSFVVVQHLSPDFDSMMDELLAKYTDMPIHVIADGMRLQPNAIYLNPPKNEVRVVGNEFSLREFEPDQLRLPINSAFNSIAHQFGTDSVAIVLSGTGSDGASGLQSVHQMAGLTITQSLDTAQFDGMPKNAIATDVVDYILSPKAIASLLVEHSLQPVARPTENDYVDTSHLSGVQLIFSLLSDDYGIDFAHYKPTTVARRIDRRRKLSRYTSVNDYAEVLREDRRELDRLYHDLLIGVTQFFRDPEAFESLHQELRHLITSLPQGKELRVWSVGCASGEESYSLAMLLRELYESEDREPTFKVFATDVHDRILEHASRGAYNSGACEGLPPEFKDKYFASHGESKIKVLPQLRNHLVFAKQNVVTDPPFTRMDLVVCRNLLIYLQDDAQQSAIAGFRYALRERGLMMLGPSETAGKMTAGFDIVDKAWRVFRKNHLPNSEMQVGLFKMQSAAQRDSSVLRLVEAETKSARTPSIAHLLMSDILEAAMLLNSKNEILSVFGDPATLLHCGDRRLDGNVSDFLTAETGTEIAKIIDHATKRLGVEFASPELQAKVNGEQLFFVAYAKSYPGLPGDPHITLLKFESPPKSRVVDNESEDPADSTGRLKGELATTRARLGSTIRRMETNNQELQSANEEMIASNEELQATNEELQSVNEELHTVNQEHQTKVIELEEMTDDFNNLFNSTNVGSILLDEELRIRKFTRAAKQYFRLMDHDIGRSLTNFACMVMIDDLPGAIRRVMESGAGFFSYVQDRESRWLTLDITPYYANNDVSGVIINMTDLAPALRAINECTGSMVLPQNAGLWQWDSDSDRMWWSPQLLRLLGLSEDNSTPSWDLFQQLAHPDDAGKLDKNALDANSRQERQCTLRMKFAGDGYRQYDFRWMNHAFPTDGTQSITGSFESSETRLPETKSSSRTDEWRSPA